MTDEMLRDRSSILYFKVFLVPLISRLIQTMIWAIPLAWFYTMWVSNKERYILLIAAHAVYYNHQSYLGLVDAHTYYPSQYPHRLVQLGIWKCSWWCHGSIHGILRAEYVSNCPMLINSVLILHQITETIASVRAPDEFVYVAWVHMHFVWKSLSKAADTSST